MFIKVGISTFDSVGGYQILQENDISIPLSSTAQGTSLIRDVRALLTLDVRKCK